MFPCDRSPQPPLSRRVRVPSRLQFAQPPLLGRADTFSIFVRSSGETEGTGMAPRSLDFHASPSRRPRVVFSNFLSTDVSSLFFAAVRRILFCHPAFLTAPRKRAVVGAVMANRSRFRMTNALGPPLFHDRSSLGWAVVKFDGKQRFTRTIARARRFFFDNVYNVS